MFLENQSYYPSMLEVQSEILKTLTEFRLYPVTLRKKYPLDLSSEEAVSSSMYEFAFLFETYLLNQFMENYLKKDAIKPEGDFRLAVSKSTEYMSRGFYMDGQHGFLLGFKDFNLVTPLWFGAINFYCGTELADYSQTIKNICRVTPLFTDPIIVQIQGRKTSSITSYPSPKQILDSILKSYKWERSLVDLTIEWALSEKISSLYLLPASLNKWTYPASDDFLRFKMRYDVTARRCGFTLSDNGLYCLPLSPLNET